MAVLSKPVSKPVSVPQRLVHLDQSSAMEQDEVTRAVVEKANVLLQIQLRDWQIRAIRSLLQGRDLFVKAGTGSGKSAVFQSMIAAKENGIVLVITPIKSLINDQVLIIMSSSNHIGQYNQKLRYICDWAH